LFQFNVCRFGAAGNLVQRRDWEGTRFDMRATRMFQRSFFNLTSHYVTSG
jgi:hypothetical protein